MDSGRTTTEGLDQLKAKLLQRLPRAARAQIRLANEKSAAELMSRVLVIIPVDAAGTDGVHLRNSVKRGDFADGDTATFVSVGSAEAPYPAHLALGHRAKDGTHVPGKDFWYAPKRVLRKRVNARMARAMSAAIKSIKL